MPTVEVLGVYAVDVTDGLIDRAVAIQYEGDDLSESEMEEARDAVAEEMSRVALVELIVHDRDDRFDVGDFQQPDSDQAPYDEAFLSEDGARVLSRDEPPEDGPLRLAFFLHGFVAALHLETSYGSVSLPAPRSMPQRLRDLMPFEPVD